MNDPRDFLAFASYGNLGMLLLGIGLLGVLIHERPARRWLSAAVGLLGALLLNEGAALFNGQTTSFHTSVTVALLAVMGFVVLIRSVKLVGSQAPTDSVAD